MYHRNSKENYIISTRPSVIQPSTNSNEVRTVKNVKQSKGGKIVIDHRRLGLELDGTGWLPSSTETTTERLQKHFRSAIIGTLIVDWRFVRCEIL